MRSRRWAPRAAVVALMLVARVSVADDDDDHSISTFETKPTAIYGVVGLGTPVGAIGAEVEETVMPNWSLSAGLGWGMANAPQASAMIRWLGGGLRSKVTIGGGVSGGKYKWTEFCFDCDDGPVTKSGTVAWGNVEIGGEHRFWNGLALRYFGGYGHIIAGHLDCQNATPTTCEQYYEDDGTNVIYTGFGVGGAF